MSATALQFNYSDPNTRVQAPAAYARVIGLHIDVIAQTIDVDIGLYVDAAARQAGGTPLSSFHVWPPFAGIMGGPVNIQAAAYTFAKTLSTFAGAVDV